MKRASMFIACAAFAAAAQAGPILQPTQLAPLYAPACPVRLNEVMINPGNDSRQEYVELFNTSWTQSVDIGGWTLTDGEDTDAIVDYTGPHDIGRPGTVIPPRGFALIVDGDYDGAYNEWMGEVFDYYENYCGVGCIVVRVNDSAIGDGLNNTADSVTITTNWPLYTGRSTPRQTRSVSWSAADGFGSESSMPSFEWTPSGIIWERSEQEEIGCTPAAINSYEWPEC